MPKLNLVKATGDETSVAELARSLRDGARSDSPRGEQAPWRQFRVGMAMCIG